MASSNASVASEPAPTFEQGIFETPGPGHEPFVMVMHGINHESAPAEDEDETMATCNDCGLDKKIEEMQKMGSATKGRGKKVSYRCNTCNACRGRLARMMSKRGELAVDWAGLDEAERRDFFARCNAFEKDELQAGLLSTLELRKELKSTLTAAHEGSYYPLSVYAQQGYNEQHLKNIELTAPSKFDAAINDWVYQKMIDSNGVVDSSTTCNVQTSVPAAQSRAKRARDEHDAADPKQAKAEQRKEALAKKLEEKQKELEVKKKLAEDKKLAIKITSMLSPCITFGADLIRHKAPKVSGKVPDTFVQDAKLQLSNLECADIMWKEVLKGGPAPTEPHMQLKEVTEAVKKANKTFNNVSVMIKIADAQ